MHVSDSATLWTVAHQAPRSMGFSRQEHWGQLPFPPPGDLPHPATEPASPALAGRFFTMSITPGKQREGSSINVFKEKLLVSAGLENTPGAEGRRPFSSLSTCLSCFSFFYDNAQI